MNQLNMNAIDKIVSFIRNLFRSIWVFFPGILFLALVFMCFGSLSQGQDLIVLSSEHRWNFGVFIAALCFFALITWFGARKVSEIKKEKNPAYIPEKWFKHIPRFIGYSAFTVMIIAYAKSPLFNHRFKPTLLQTLIYIGIAAFSVIWYIVCVTYTQKKFKFIEFNTKFWVYTAAFAIVTIILCLSFTFFPALIFFELVLAQLGFLVLVITRRSVIENKAKHNTADKVLRFIFRLLILFAIIVYVRCLFCIEAAVKVTAFPFVFLAFCVFITAGYWLSYYSVKKALNIHIIILGIVFLFGLWTERHNVFLPIKEKVNFSQRATLEKYFTKWLKAKSADINMYDTINKYPVYFVLSDGGASRSGYWVASVMSRLQDESEGKFGKHLFCLSGASGGSVGNAAFYMLLREMNKQPVLKKDSLYLKRAKGFLKSDFLTYTLSRMLCHDFFIQLSPLSSYHDRARALTESIEGAPDDSVFLKNKLAAPFSQLMINDNDPDVNFPILCINTTRMQDGKPAVISNINISKNKKDFNERIDVLGILQKEKDMKLSTAVVLGASFPYVSPAGRIDQDIPNAQKDSVRENYFVDGGYVDNSGAGVVHEMILQLNDILLNTKDPVLQALKNKIQFTVIHITNGVEGDILAKKVNPFINDLAAPLKTLVGTFSIQTTVNDSRLKNYLDKNKGVYKNINLYRDDTLEHFSMNWVISEATLRRMDKRLYQSDTLNKLAEKVNSLKN